HAAALRDRDSLPTRRSSDLYLLDRAGRLGEAAEVYRQAAAGQESLLRGHPKVARYRHRLFGIRILLGNVLREASRPAEAAEEYRDRKSTRLNPVTFRPRMPS